MNVRNTKTRVPTVKNIHNLPAEPLAGNNAIPKQHVGAEQANQLEFNSEVGRIFSPISNQQTYTNQIDFKVIPTAYFCLDENPFDLLPKDLFDISLSEDDEVNQPKTNEEVVRTTPKEVYQSVENNGGFEKIQEDEYVAANSSQDESSSSLFSDNTTYHAQPVIDHPLIKPIAEKWLKDHKWVGPQFSKRKSEINKFIRFLVNKKIQVPTREHIPLYYQALLNDPKINSFKPYVSAVRSLFSWAEEATLYENIAAGIKVNTRRNPPKWVNKPPVREKTKNTTNIPKSTITIHDMITAQFLYKDIEYLINNDLIVFKQWVETLDVESVDDQRKGYLLKFAHFLHSENRTTPTQQDIVDYYKEFLMQTSPITVNKNMTSIRRFFTWTAENTIYPNIAINIYTTRRKPINADDIPILPDKEYMQPIPNPTKPLINKTI